MSKHTINGYITYQKYSWEDEPRVGFSMYDHNDGMTVAVKKHFFDVEIPDDFDPRLAQVAALEAEKLRIRAEFSKRVSDLDTAISNLLSIENEVSE